MKNVLTLCICLVALMYSCNEGAEGNRDTPSFVEFSGTLDGSAYQSSSFGSEDGGRFSLGFKTEIQSNDCSSTAFSLRRIPISIGDYQLNTNILAEELVSSGSVPCGDLIFATYVLNEDFDNRISVTGISEDLISGEFSISFLREEEFGEEYKDAFLFESVVFQFDRNP